MRNIGTLEFCTFFKYFPKHLESLELNLRFKLKQKKILFIIFI